MIDKRNYAELVDQAQKAVSGVKDPELKGAAPQASAAKRKASPVPGHKVKPAKSGPQACIEEMVADGFFKKPKTIAQVKAELENRGHHIPLTSLSGPLQRLTQRKVLRRHKSKTSGKGQTFVYSNW
jgi:hypothetical protein